MRLHGFTKVYQPLRNSVLGGNDSTSWGHFLQANSKDHLHLSMWGRKAYGPQLCTGRAGQKEAGGLKGPYLLGPGSTWGRQTLVAGC